MAHDLEHQQDNSDLLQASGRKLHFITLAAIFVALTLIGIKSYAWFVSSSIALLSALLDSLMDLMISVLNFFVVKHALTPADQEHRFGHGKAEALAALFQGLIISVMALYLVYESVERFQNPIVITQGNIGIAVMVISIVLTLLLVTAQRQIARQTGSVAVLADSAHYKGDLFMNLGVIIALVANTYGGLGWADPVAGLVVAGLLLNSAREILSEAANQLMDHELPEAERENIKKIILSHPDVKDLHDLRTRRSGIYKFIQCHVELDGNMSLRAAHDISDAIEANVIDVYPEAEVIIHQDPEGFEEVSNLERS